MKRPLCVALAVLTGAALAPAYVEAPYSLGRVCQESTNTRSLRRTGSGTRPASIQACSVRNGTPSVRPLVASLTGPEMLTGSSSAQGFFLSSAPSMA